MKIPRKVYAIQHNITSKIYVGSSAYPDERYKSHIYALRRGKHNVSDMQEDFIKHGEDYSFYILDTINSFQERGKEYEWIKKLESNNREKGYNYKDSGVNTLVIPYKEGIPNINKKMQSNTQKERK